MEIGYDKTFATRDDNGIPATVAVAGDTWYHVMQHSYPSGSPRAPALQQGGDAGFNSVVYVDGIAVSATNDLPDAGDFNLGERVGVLSVGAAELANQDADPETADFGKFFDGTVDDLRLYLYGDNSSAGGHFLTASGAICSRSTLKPALAIDAADTPQNLGGGTPRI